MTARPGRPQLHRSPHDHHTDTRRPAQQPGSLRLPSRCRGRERIQPATVPVTLGRPPPSPIRGSTGLPPCGRCRRAPPASPGLRCAAGPPLGRHSRAGAPFCALCPLISQALPRYFRETGAAGTGANRVTLVALLKAGRVLLCGGGAGAVMRARGGRAGRASPGWPGRPRR
jgi:hypothetical protein